MIKSGSKVKEVKWMGQFVRGDVLTVKARIKKQVLLTDTHGQEFWDNISNVVEVADVK